MLPLFKTISAYFSQSCIKCFSWGLLPPLLLLLLLVLCSYFFIGEFLVVSDKKKQLMAKIMIMPIITQLLLPSLIMMRMVLHFIAICSVNGAGLLCFGVAFIYAFKLSHNLAVYDTILHAFSTSLCYVIYWFIYLWCGCTIFLVDFCVHWHITYDVCKWSSWPVWELKRWTR